MKRFLAEDCMLITLYSVRFDGIRSDTSELEQLHVIYTAAKPN